MPVLFRPPEAHQKPLIGFLYSGEILDAFHVFTPKRKEGFRDYALLHLLFDLGPRASEVATINPDYFNPKQKTLAIPSTAFAGPVPFICSPAGTRQLTSKTV